MQFEEFDKKIKEAAENHHPAYDEQAWARMSKLLDKHMPEKEERRRRFIWLFFLLFLVGGAGVFYGVQSLVTSNSAGPAVSATVKRTAVKAAESPEGNKRASATGQIESAKSPAVRTPQPAGTTIDQDIVQPENGKELTPVNEKNKQEKPTLPLSASANTGIKSSTRNSIRNGPDIPVAPLFQSGIAKKKKKSPAVSSVVAGKTNTGTIPVSQNEPDQGNPIAVKKTAVPVPVSFTSPDDQPADSLKAITKLIQQKSDTASVAVAEPSNDPPVKPEKRSSHKKQSRFILTLSAGPDASFTTDGKPGRLIPVTGAGIGYIYRDRFSIRAGFYNAAKVYTASPDAYNAPANFYAYYPFLVKVDANCRVYEIPVSLGYHFGARKNHSWFASASLSSYLMKRETYNYSYKTSAWGAVQQREWNFTNRNQHLFSVLGLSAGYQRKITERISFIAEPYLRMPFQGVGYGKVKLNSAGVLFSLAVQPAALIPSKQKK